ncbi:MAG: hypothetical protein CMP26_05245 [Roseibacillus sp.]|nr:hypothetical protein [Roseibacillus sp.]
MSPEQLKEQGHQSSDIISAYEYFFCSDSRPFCLSEIAWLSIGKLLLQGRKKRHRASFSPSEKTSDTL